MTPSNSCSVLTITFVLIISVELGCGLVATVWTAFFYDKVRSVYWGYGILAIYLAFFSVVAHHVAKEVCCQSPISKENLGRKKLAKVSWLCWICAFVTFGIFGVLYFYDTIALRQTSLNTVVAVSLVVFVLTFILMTAVSCSYLCDYLCPRGSGRSFMHDHIDESEFSRHSSVQRKMNA